MSSDRSLLESTNSYPALLLLCVLWVNCCFLAAAQPDGTASQDLPTPEELSLTVIRGGETIKLDGVLDEEVWQRADVLIAPVTPNVAFEHGDANGTANSWMMQGFNLTGWPVAVVPCGLDQAGLPAGVQVIGRPWQDHEVLAVAKAIETALGGYRAPDNGQLERG